ncbi:10473_t:CDS:1 [Ambispora leptoticha]|uniref:10473_t:CDS:1 n=1 Tax=Ambispora leptoticha TaxID=144679 RepID=A0A9N9CM78_9GLOM|nr:10473_t:CDS:1 [Ambispora leptoticha]
MSIINSQSINDFENNNTECSCNYSFETNNLNDTKRNDDACSLNETNDFEWYDPETLYFKDFDGNYCDEQECEIKITSEKFSIDYFSYASEWNSDSDDDNSSSDDDISILSNGSDNYITSYSPFPIDNYSLSSETKAKRVPMTSKTYRDFLINYYKLKISQIRIY